MIPPYPVVFLFGATGVGKTASLTALREGLVMPIEVISADSMQVYTGMDIGTAKPSPSLRAQIPHHLIDILSPDTQFTLAQFITRSEELVPEIVGRGALPVVCGGTAFYFKHLLYGMPEAPASQPEIRRQLEDELELHGLEHLRGLLAEIDPISWKRIGSHDAYRVVRALEVWRISGRALSSFAVVQKKRTDWRVSILGLTRPREELYRRIDQRVEQMFADGLEQEVADLLAAGYGPNDPGMRGIGYREFFLESGSSEARKELIQRNSRRYAKRQETFFRSIRGVRWNHPENIDTSIQEVRRLLDG